MHTFNDGDTAICVGSRSYMFTTNKKYTIIKFHPPCRIDGSAFTWPAYVTVIDDTGKTVSCHAHRFIPANKDET